MNTETATPAKKPYRMVVGFDLSELSSRALEEALDIARSRTPAELHVITACRPHGLLVAVPGQEEPITEEGARAIVQRRLSEIVKANQEVKGSVGLDRISVYVITDMAAEEPSTLITTLAESVDADLIVVGTHGRRGVSRVLLGSVAARVVKDATTGVYVVRPADFVRGEKIPAIQPPLKPGEAHLKHFEHRRTFHYVNVSDGGTARTMPAS